MSMNPVVTGVLDNVLGSSLVARDHDPMGGFMDEIPRWANPVTGQFEPIPGHQMDLPAPAPGWGHRPGSFKDLLLRPGQEGTFGPIGPYYPERDKSKIVPLGGVGNV